MLLNNDQLCYVDMLEPYYDRNGTQNDVKFIAFVNVNVNTLTLTNAKHTDTDSETELLFDSARTQTSCRIWTGSLKNY